MTFSKIKGLKTHFSKLRDQNMILSKVKGPETYFSPFQIYFGENSIRVLFGMRDLEGVFFLELNIIKL